MTLRGCLMALLLAGQISGAFAQQGFFLPATDANLRDDVRLLVDDGVIGLPASAWPLPAADVADAVARVDPESLHAEGLRSALLRVQARVGEGPGSREWRLSQVSVAGGRAALLRDYQTPAREDLEVTFAGGAGNDRWNLSVVATASPSPDESGVLRLDGSDATVRFGNWLFSVNQMDRWWGDGSLGNLVLSTNARPMPQLAIDRMRSTRSNWPILRWLGPWRFSGFLGALESERADVDRPLFLGMRVSFKPAPILEFGVSRTAQFCGKGRPCDASTFWNVLAGRDNAGMRVAPEDEPGNQMAGFDMRVVSPFDPLPVAAFAQLIGEDGSSTGIPERYLGQFGLEAWSLRESGAVLRGRVEYANTNCKFYAPTKDLALFPNCAYRQGIFRAGYRFHSRNIGHTTDADSESVSVLVSARLPSGDSIGLTLRRALLDRHAGVDPFNPLTQGPGEYRSAQIDWSGAFRGLRLTLQVGYEQQDPVGRDGAFGTVRLTKPL